MRFFLAATVATCLALVVACKKDSRRQDKSAELKKANDYNQMEEEEEKDQKEVQGVDYDDCQRFVCLTSKMTYMKHAEKYAGQESNLRKSLERALDISNCTQLLRGMPPPSKAPEGTYHILIRGGECKTRKQLLKRKSSEAGGGSIPPTERQQQHRSGTTTTTTTMMITSTNEEEEEFGPSYLPGLTDASQEASGVTEHFKRWLH